MNFILHILTYVITLCSFIGFGYFFAKLFKVHLTKDSSQFYLGYLGIYSIFFLLLFSLIANLFIPLNIYVNSLILFFGLFYFSKLFFTSTKFLRGNFYFFLSIFISIFSIFFKKNHDDFSYYHLGFIDNLTASKIEFGLGNFDIAFNHVSSIFFLNATVKNFLTQDFFYFAIPLSILVFANTILLSEIFKKQKINLHYFLSLFSFIFINIFFYRVADHGTDKTAQILIFLLIINLIKMFNKKKEDLFLFEFNIILLTLIISLKSFYFLYSIFFIILYFKFYKLNEIILFIKKYHLIYISFLIVFLIIFYNFAYSGCFVYPLTFLCLKNIFWSYGLENTKKAYIWYEIWSKGGAGPNFRVSNPEIYIQGFNWISNWVKVYFFNKVADTLFGILLIIISFFIAFKVKKLNLKTDFVHWIIYILILFLLVLWFFKNPALRYGGGYVILALTIFFPLAILFKNQEYKFDIITKKIKILVIITFVIFTFRNVKNAYYEIKSYHYLPFSNPHYEVEDKFKRVKQIKKIVLEQTNNCQFKENRKNKIKCKLFGDYIFYYR